MTWGEGATEGGSSGSPLIDADTGKVVGVLTGGFSSCLQPLADYYGRLSAVRAANDTPPSVTAAPQERGVRVMWRLGGSCPWPGQCGSGAAPGPAASVHAHVPGLDQGFAQPPTAPRRAQAWAGGLDHYLSTNPPADLLDDVAYTLSQSMDGAVVVQSINGSASTAHGPGLAFYPSVLNLSPGFHNATFNY